MRASDLRQERERRRREDCREVILSAAERVILRKGFSAMRMDDVAREAQFSKATLYKYFSSKGVLLYEIMGHYFEEVGRRLTAIMADPASAGEKLRRSIRMTLEYHAEKENITRVLWMDNSMLRIMRVFVAPPGKAQGGTATDRKMLGILQQKRQAIVKTAARMIEDGVAAGEFRRLDAESTVTFIEAVVEGYAHGQFWMGKAVTPEAADGLARFILEGIRKPERTGKEN